MKTTNARRKAVTLWTVITATGIVASALTLAGCTPAPIDSSPTVSETSAEVASVAALVPDAYKKRGTLRAVMSVGTAPTKYLDPSDGKTMLGSDPELAVALGAVMGLDVEVSGVALDQIVTGLQSARYDFAVSQMGVTPERLEVLDMIEYSSSAAALASAKDNPLKLSFDTLCGHTVGGQAGSVQLTTYLPTVSEACIEKGEAPVIGQDFSDQQSALLALKSGRIDAVFGDKPVLSYAVKQDPDSYAVAADYTEARPVAIAVPNDSDLLPALEAALNTLVENGAYGDIMDKWGLTELNIAAAKVRTDQ